MQQFHIREYIEKDIDGILALFKCSFNKETSAEWFRWKYQYSPWGSKGYVVIDDKMIVAFYGGIKLSFGFKGKTLWAYQFCDVMTHPQYRGRFITKSPLIVKAGEMFYRENMMDFAFGFPSLRHARLQSIRLGGEGYRLVRSYTKEYLKSYSFVWKLKVEEGMELLKKEKLDKFLVQHNGSALQILKDEHYIRWRYENPLKKYGLLVFKRMNKINGYIIFTIEDSWFDILEILYEKDKDKDVRDILLALEAYIVKNMNTVKGVRGWFHPMEPVTGYLDNLGYNSEDSIPLAFKSVNAACGVTSEIFYNRYFYRTGDYDAS